MNSLYFIFMLYVPLSGNPQSEITLRLHKNLGFG